jgi:PPM family protein phosphatase
MTADNVTTRSIAPAAAPTHHPRRQAELRVSACSDRGLVRTNNEDRYLALKLSRTTTLLNTNIDPAQLQFVPEQDRWALVVADGMGGHAAGEVASTLAITLALKLSQQGSRWYVDIGEAEANALIERMQAILTTVDRAIAEQSEQQASLRGMGTTLTIATIAADRLFVFHVGDSRCYLLRNGRLQRLTHDQTMTQMLVDAGVMPAEALHTHHMRHMLTQAMGKGEVVIDAQHLPLEQGDRLMLSSDGLTDGVSDAEIENVLKRGECDAACNELMHKALEAGGRDNITVIVADVELRQTD